MSNIEPSVSSHVVEYLRNTMPIETRFTCDELRIQCGLPEADYGAVSGTLSRARKAGLVEFIGVNDKHAYTYHIADRNAVIHTKAVRGKGGIKGHARKPHKQFTEPKLGTSDKPTDEQYWKNGPSDDVTPQGIDKLKNLALQYGDGKPAISSFLEMAEQLLNIAVELQRAAAAPLDLSGVSAQALLAELTKRMPE